MDLLGVTTRFSEKGRFGPIHCGASLPELAATMGEPHRIGVEKHRHRNVWPRWFGFGDVRLEVCACQEIDLILLPVRYRETVKVPGFGGLPTLPRVTLTRFDRLVAGEVDDDQAGAVYLRTRPAKDVQVSFAFTARESWDGPVLDDPVLDQVVATRSGHECVPA